MWTALKKRAPEALFEAALIIFAVLVALGVDEYREKGEQRTLAASALERIAAEIRDNRAEILQGRDGNRGLLGDLEEASQAIAAGVAPGLTSVNYEVALLGDDAWETARITRAVQFIDFDEVSRISKAYRVQQLYQERQNQVVSDIATIGGREFQEVFGAIRGGLAITLKMECDLIAEYDGVLAGSAPVRSTEASTPPVPGCEQQGSDDAPSS